MSDIGPGDMAGKEAALDKATSDAGCQLGWPFMNMFVLPITAILEYTITDLGAVDCIGVKIFVPVLETV